MQTKVSIVDTVGDFYFTDEAPTKVAGHLPPDKTIWLAEYDRHQPRTQAGRNVIAFMTSLVNANPALTI